MSAPHRPPTHLTGTGRRRRRLGLVVGASTLAAVLGTSAVTAAPGSPAEPSPEAPGPVSPEASGAPDSIDGEAMRHRMLHERAPDVGARHSSDLTTVTEREKPAASTESGVGDAGAQRLPSSGKDAGLRIDGRLRTKDVEPRRIARGAEDDGSIPQARDLRLRKDRGIAVSGRIGDGPHGAAGSGSGDFDFHEVRVAKGETLTVDVAPRGELTPHVLLYDTEGTLVSGAQDLTGDGAVHLSFPVAEGGTYYVAVGQHYPTDPFDSGSGPQAMTEGPYDLEVTRQTARTADTDVYALPLRKGEVLGATVEGSAGRVAIHGPDGRLLQGSAVDQGSILPDDSPLPRGGNATADHVVERSGLYFLTVSDGAGDYSATVRASRPPRAEQPQTIYLDFSGPRFDNRVFGESAVEPGVRTVSPMRDFLPRWGLEESDERAVVEATTRRVREALRHDLPGSRVRVVNSLDHPDLFGRPGVSRVIIGGTPEEAGVMPSFGLSESVDPGNFAREETALVTPGPMSQGDEAPSLNYFLTADSDRVKAVGQSLGNVAAHEAGHFLGSYHTDDLDDSSHVMNTGNLLHFFAFGEDGVSGTDDDVRNVMGTGRYDPLQGFFGEEDTAARTRAALDTR